MSENNNRRSIGRDALGILGIVIGVFGAVSIVMAARQPVYDPEGEPVGLAMRFAHLFGPVSGMFAALGVALVGMRIWLRGFDGSVVRHLVGVLITTFMLSILVGTIDASLAGSFGATVGSAVRARFTVWVAVPTGIALVLLPAWFAWLRPAERHAKSEKSGSLASVLAGTTESGGVTTSEAEALLPRTAPVTAAPSAKANTPNVSASPASTAPYPTDVRLTGGIPPGAKPLESPYGRSFRSAHDVVDVHHAGDAAHPAGAGAARDVAASGSASEHPLEAPSAGPFAASALGAGSVGLGDAGSLSDEALDPSEVEAAFTAELPVQAVPARPYSTAPAAPSWEQPEMFDEPVDAYGTPMSLVESLRKGAPSEETPSEPVPALDLAGVDLDDDADVESVQPIEIEANAPVAVLAPEAEAIAEVVSAPTVLVVEHAEVETVVVAQAALPEEPEVAIPPTVAELPAEPELTAQPELPVQPEIAAVPELEPAAEVPVQPEIAAIPEVPALPEVEAVPEAPVAMTSEAYAAEAPASSVSEASAELSSAVAVLDAEPEVAVAEDIVSEVVVSEVVISEAIEEAPAVAPAPVIPATLEEPVQPSLFADIAPEPVRPAAKSKGSRGGETRSAPATASVAPTPKPSRRAEAVEEPEAPHAISDVVLTPVPSRSVSRVFLPEPTYRAGCLFLERNRVAVSMLQREFNMDFKVATAVLDQLQDVGLIGPYLGGQRRDILMSHDEWQEKVGVAE
jgi:hypothetical protein